MIEYSEETRVADIKWYKDNLKRLFDTYGECYIAIRHKSVVCTYSASKYKFHEAYNLCKEKLKDDSFTFQYCSLTDTPTA